MLEAWNGEEGEVWARDWARYDRSVAGYTDPLLDAAAIEPHHLVLDVGCGTGELTRAAGRRAAHGAAVGVDLSGRMLEQARALTAQQGPANVDYLQEDAQTVAFEQPFHRVVSRFGVMFFADPVAAFGNLGHALRPGGRLVAVVWRGLADNRWLREVWDVLDPDRVVPRPAPGSPGPLGLADAATTARLLDRTGFVEVSVEPVDAPFFTGRDVDDALTWVRRLGLVRGLGGRLDPAARERALARLRALLAEHETADGVLLDSAAWLVRGSRPGTNG